MTSWRDRAGAGLLLRRDFGADMVPSFRHFTAETPPTFNQHLKLFTTSPTLCFHFGGSPPKFSKLFGAEMEAEEMCKVTDEVSVLYRRKPLCFSATNCRIMLLISVPKFELFIEQLPSISYTIAEIKLPISLHT
jgi:hypothetical protein